MKKGYFSVSEIYKISNTYKMARVIPKESTSTFIFTVIALTNFVNLSTYQRLFLNSILFRLQLAAISEKSIEIRSAKNKLQSCRNTRYINYTFVYRQEIPSLQISDIFAYINIFKAEHRGRSIFCL